MDSDPTRFLSSSSTPKLPIKRKSPPNSPIKFHRIWTEPDEIRFLQGLLESASDNLCFPRDLGVFFARFSENMDQPYTRSQLSEKLRRLRKKFRVISIRLEKGHDWSQLSPHDRALFEISKQLWSPDFAASSPFCRKKSGSDQTEFDEVTAELVGDEMVDLSGFGCGVEKITANLVMDVFDECLRELGKGEKSSLDGYFKQGSFEERWRKQRIAELSVLSKRMRLVIDHSLHE